MTLFKIYSYDELRPVTNETNSSWGGFGVTIFDALDTLLIMGLEPEYIAARDHALSVSFDKVDCPPIQKFNEKET
jgi:mannosyl-oligosaccharide alpha-1,2-mannosidase